MVKAPLTNTLDVQLNLYNLTNKEYYDAVYTDHVIPGAGFSAALSIMKKL
jgi:outer membrane receptor for monomeric catechols